MSNQWDSFMYNPFDLSLGCDSCDPTELDDSFDIFANFDNTFGNTVSWGSKNSNVAEASKGKLNGKFDATIGDGADEKVNHGVGTPDYFPLTVDTQQTRAQQQRIGSAKTQLSPLSPTASDSDQENRNLEYPFDDAEETYTSGLRGDHGSLGRPSFAPVMSVQQAKALAVEKEVVPRKAQEPALNRATSSSSRSDMILSDLKQLNPTRKISTVSVMSQTEASEKFKMKYGDPAAEKKKKKEMAARLSAASKPKKIDLKQNPEFPKRKSDPIRSALAKPPSFNMATSTLENKVTTDKMKPKVIPFHTLV